MLHMALEKATVYHEGRLMQADVSLDGGRIVDVSNFHEAGALPLTGKLLIPGLVDVHVHLREPGFFYKEGMAHTSVYPPRAAASVPLFTPSL